MRFVDFGSEGADYVISAAEDHRGRGQIGDRPQVGAARDAVNLDCAAIVGVRQKIGDAQHSDERHQDAHADSATPEVCLPHVSKWPNIAEAPLKCA